MISHLLTIFLPVLSLFLGFLLFIAIRYKGFVEEDHLGEPRLTSPAFKLVKNVIVKSFLSLELILILLSVYTLSFTVDHVSTYAHTSQAIEVPHKYSTLMVKRGFVPLDVINEITERYIILYQVFGGVELDNETYYIIIIECGIDHLHREDDELLHIMNSYCAYLNNGYVIVDYDSNINLKDVSSLFVGVKLFKADLSRLVDIEFAPGLYAVHSIGTIGGLSLRIEQHDRLLLAPMMTEVLDIIRDKRYDIQTIVIDYDSRIYSENNSEVGELLDVFDYIVVNENGRAIIMSGSYIPTSQTIIGIVLSFIISMILIYAVGGGFIEKIIVMGKDLFVLGVTKELFTSSVVLGILITMFLSALPLIILCSIGLAGGIAVLNFVISTIGFVTLTSYKLRTNIGKTPHLGFITSYSYVIDTYVPPEDLISCFRELLKEEDFFMLNEIEKVEEKNTHVVRLELIYKKALSTIASVEVFIDRIDRGAKYTIITDVWSLEDLSSKTISTIYRMALSKFVGGVMSCLEG